MPKLPFSLFDFKKIERSDPILNIVEAAAGDAIPVTTLYEVPEHKVAWIHSIAGWCVKTTGTLFALTVKRLPVIKPAVTFNEYLLNEAIGTEAWGWPSNKSTAEHTLGWHLLFLWPGEQINIAHALTALETIAHRIIINRFEYADPRYEK